MDISYILNNFDVYESMLKQRFVSPKILEDISSLHKSYVKEAYECQQLQALKNKINIDVRRNEHKKDVSINKKREEVDDIFFFLNEKLQEYPKEFLYELSKEINNLLDNKDVHKKNLQNQSNV